MPVQAVTEHVYSVQMEDVKVFIIDGPDGLVLVDTGFPGTLSIVEDAVRSLGRDLSEVTDILVTHSHIDHAGGLADLLKATEAKAWMHPADAQMVREGRSFRPWQVTPGEENRIFAETVIAHVPTTFEPAPVEGEVTHGEEIPAAGGIIALEAPGHSEGHLMFLWPGDGGVLFLGDVAKNINGLVLPPIHEDLAKCEESLRAIGDQEFAVACFGHGDPIVGDAADTIREMLA